MSGARAWSAIAILLLLAPVASALIAVDDGAAPAVVSDAPPASRSMVVGAPGPMQAMADEEISAGEPSQAVSAKRSAAQDAPVMAQTPADALAAIEAMLPEGAEPEALLNLRELVRMQQPENGTNETSISDEHGTVTHRHAHVGEQGLSPVWAAAFYGTPSVFAYMDLDGDGSTDTLVGSSIAITAISGATGQPLWVHHIGSRVVSIFPVDSNGDGVMEVGFATRFGGQNPQVAVLRAVDGHEVWAYFGDSSYIEAGVAVEGSGDIVAVDIWGRHIRLAGVDGSVIRESEPWLPVPGLYDFGAIAGGVGDVNGDGVQDTVSVHFTWMYQNLVAERISGYQLVIHAVDGSNGALLWTSQLGSPPSDWFSYTFLTGFTMLDADGDGDQDVGISAYGYSFYYTRAGFHFVYGAYLHIIDGSSNVVGQPIGVRDILQPEIPFDYYGQLSHHDSDGDGSEELLVMHSSLVGGLTGASVAIERYVPATTGSPGALVTDLSVAIDNSAGFRAPFALDGETAVPVVWTEGLTGHVAVLHADGTLSATSTFPGSQTTAAGHDGQRFLVGTPEEVVFRDTVDGDDVASFAMRGTPYVLTPGDHDGDRIDDMWIVSSDGNVYILDGLTGSILRSIDRDDIVVDVFLQDADRDGDLDPYFQILKDGIAFEGVFYAYDAQTVLYDLEEDKPVWTVDGFPFRDLWFDADVDGRLDFIADYDSDYDYDGGWITDVSYEVVSGETGDIITDASVTTPGFFYPWDVIAFATGDGMGVAMMDPYDGFLMVGPDGKKIKGIDLDDADYYGGCIGAVDFDGDGVDTVLFAASDRDDKTDTYAYSAAGNRSELDFLPNIDIDDCTLLGVDDRKGGQDLLAMVTDYDGDDVRRIMLRYSEADGEVWKEDGKQGTPGTGWFTYIGRDARAPDGGRIFYGYQDHVFARSWDSGEIVGQFTVNGPFVVNGALIELDAQSPSEVVALTSDGLVWALAEDRDAVVEAVAKEAREQGKELTTDLDEVEDILQSAADKKSPGPALPMLAIGLLAVGLLRRR